MPAGTLVTLEDLTGISSTNVGTIQKLEGGSFNFNFGEAISVITGATTPGDHGTFVTALSVGATDPLLNTGLTAGTNALVFTQNGANSTEFGTSWDVGCINRATSDTTFTSAAEVRAACNNPENWVRDGTPNDSTGNDNAEARPLTDPNSPLFEKTALSIEEVPNTGGSIAFVGFSADNADESITFVALESIPTGTPITFHCRAWNGSSFDTTTGASITVTFHAELAYGTVVNIAGLNTGNPVVICDTEVYSVSMSGTWDLVPGGAVYATAGDSHLDPNQHGGFLGALAVTDEAPEAILGGTGLIAGDTAVVLPVGGRFDQLNDVGSIGDDFTGHFPDPTAARLAYHNATNWIRDGSVNGGVYPAAESRPLTDPHSPLFEKWRIAICFMPGTLIRTPAGEAAVEALAIGDLVLTSDGRAVPVKWIGRQTVSLLFADPIRVLPIRISAGALSDNLPSRDLLISPDHALLVEGILVNAGALVNGTSIVRERDVPMTFTYYHVELSDHALILAENTPAETFIDNVERMTFDNWAEHQALYPDAESIPEMTYPRAKSARQVPQAIRRRLAARAGSIIAPNTKAA